MVPWLAVRQEAGGAQVSELEALHVCICGLPCVRIKTMVSAPQIAAQHGVLLPGHLYVLAGIEVLAALGLLVRRLASAATLALLCVFSVAAVIDVALGEIPAHLLLYSAITLLLHNGATAGTGVFATAVNGGR